MLFVKSAQPLQLDCFSSSLERMNSSFWRHRIGMRVAEGV